MADIAQITSGVQNVLTAATQEILVISVFFMSLLLWRHIGQRSKVAKQQKIKVEAPASEAKKVEKRQSTETVDPNTLRAVKDAETQILKLLEHREFTRALNFFRTFERDGRDRHFSEPLFSSLIQSSIRVGKIDVVERLLRSMKRRGTEPSREFWRIILKMLSSRKHFDACLSIAVTHGNSLPADKVVYSCLINGALEHGSPERAMAMLDRYRKASDLEPRDFVLIFRTYVAVNDVDAAEKVFRELGPNMSALMLNLLLLTCVKAQDPHRALRCLHEACTFQDLRSSNTGAEVVEKDPIFDVVSFNTVIKGFAQDGNLAKCFDCLHEMRSRSLEPDDVTFGTLLDMCIADNDMGKANEIVNLVMRADGPVDAAVCTSFIKGLVRAQKLPKAMELYEEMKRRSVDGARPDVATYSVLIKAFVDSHALDNALLIVEDMEAAGHTPDDIILTHLLEGCRHLGNHELGKKLFADMLASGVRPSDYTLITMVKLHGRCGAHDEAYELVASWERLYALKPSVIHYTCLMSGCMRTKNYDQAWKAYQLMLDMKVVPDEMTISTLLSGLVAAQQWDRLLSLVTYGLKAHPRIPVAAETLNNALAQMLSSEPGNSPHADELVRLMRTAGVRIATRNIMRHNGL